MARQGVFLLPFALTATIVAASWHAVSERGFGVDKVVEMMEEMSAKAIKERDDEKVAHFKTRTVCENEYDSLIGKLAKAHERINLLKAAIEKQSDAAEKLGADSDELSKTIEELSSELQQKTNARKEAHDTFEEKSSELSKSVDELSRAHLTLKNAARDRAGASAALAQMDDEGSLAPKLRDVITALMETSETTSSDYTDAMSLTDTSEPGVADAYKSKSGGIIDTLEQMRNKAAHELKVLRTTEMKAKHDEELVMQQLAMSIKTSKKEKAEKLASKVKREKEVAFNKKQLASTREDKDESQKLQDQLISECREAFDEFELNQETREGEIAALTQAIKVIKSNEVSTGKKHLDLVQSVSRRPATLAQLSAQGSLSVQVGSHRRVREYLEAQARILKSKSLAFLAERMFANPFAKVSGMIEDMISRLEEEAKEDASKASFCEVETAKNKDSRTRLTEDVDALSSKIDDGKAKITTLGEEIDTLKEDLAEINKAQDESKALRAQEKSDNEVIISESTAAKEAVEKAVGIIKEFYKKAAGKASLLQEAASDPYTGLQSEGGAVLSMMEVIRADFAEAAANAKKDEIRSMKKHSAFMTQSGKSKEVKERNLRLRGEDKATEESDLEKNQADLESTSQELKAANKYAEKLEDKCVDKGTSFKERAAARKAEIQSLQEALEIL